MDKYKPGGGGGGGAQLLLISYVARLHGICNGTLKRMEVGEGGHNLQPHSPETGDKCPHPKFLSFVWD